MRFYADKQYGTFTLIPTLIWEYDMNWLYIQFLFWEFGIEW